MKEATVTATNELRHRFVQTVRSGTLHEAIQAAGTLLATDPGIRQWSFVRRHFDAEKTRFEDLKSLHVALLSSFSIEFVQDPLAAAGYLEGLELDIYQAGFAQYRQEILDRSSGLYQTRPDIVFLALEGRHLVPELYGDFLDLSANAGQALVDRVLTDMDSLFSTARRHCEAVFVVHALEPVDNPDLGVLDGHVGTGQNELINRINQGLLDLARARQGFFVLDYPGLLRRQGSRHWYDERMRCYAQAPIARAMIPELARAYLRYLRAIAGRSRKCLVVDLDNTLWGGVVGEDGVEGVRLGPDYPGSAFMAFQKEILKLWKRGVILAIASKNNPADVQELFERHPHMVLGRQHFAAMEIHWQPKSESLKNIARRLNIGLEHTVFVDDNPTECAQVALELPMLTVIRLPEQPEDFVSSLTRDGLFDGLSFSAEDRKRNDLYRQRIAAEDLRSNATSLEAFYRQLDMEVDIRPVDNSSLPRVAQLTQKTNQFNLTSIRYTEPEVATRFEDPNWQVWRVIVRDRFGDNGIVGVMMTRIQQEVVSIDTFLLSCRVIGRTVETAMLAHLCKQAVAQGCRRLRGRVRPTPKNTPARDLYQRHKFERIDGDTAEDCTHWELNLERSTVSVPDWLRLVV